MYDEALEDGFHEVVEFDATMRCDACQAQAFALARKSGLSELLFCLHHLKKHYDALLDNDWTVVEDYEGIESLAPVPTTTI